MLGHGAGIGYTGPIDNFSLVTGAACLSVRFTQALWQQLLHRRWHRLPHP